MRSELHYYELAGPDCERRVNCFNLARCTIDTRTKNKKRQIKDKTEDILTIETLDECHCDTKRESASVE